MSIEGFNFKKTHDLLDEILTERLDQHKNWGIQRHPDGTGSLMWEMRRDYYRKRAEARAKAGALTWLDILKEEVSEAFAENDPDRLRHELIQVAAVCVAWLESLDDKGGSL